MVDRLTRYHHGIYYLEHKQIFSNWIQNLCSLFKGSAKKFSSVCVQDGICWFILAGKIQGGTPLKCLSKKLPGETLCKCFQIFPPKDLVYKGYIFRWHLCNKFNWILLNQLSFILEQLKKIKVLKRNTCGLFFEILYLVNDESKTTLTFIWVLH